MLKEMVPLAWRTRIADWRGRGPYVACADSHRAIFIHVPKTAGQSVAMALFGPDAKFDHVPYFTYERANPAKFRAYFKFAFIRNPWDRLVSAYFYMLRPDNSAWVKDAVRSFPDFDSFVKGWVSEQNINSVESGYYTLLPQSYFLLNSTGKVMVDFLGCFERLDEDYRHLRQAIGVGAPNLPFINKSEHRDYKSYYTQETRGIVGRAYARDIESFGYEF